MRMLSWYGLFGTFTGIALVTVMTLPLAALVVAVRWRTTGTVRAPLAEVAMVHSTVPMVWMTLLPGSHAGEVIGRVSLVPMRDLASMGSVGIVGNLLVFAALGFFAPLRFPALASVRGVVALAAGCSLLIEVAQFVLLLDRVSSVDDVLLNAAGAGIAAWLSRPWWLTPADGPVPGPRSPRPRRAVRSG